MGIQLPEGIEENKDLCGAFYLVVQVGPDGVVIGGVAVGVVNHKLPAPIRIQVVVLPLQIVLCPSLSNVASRSLLKMLDEFSTPLVLSCSAGSPMSPSSISSSLQ